MNVFLKAVAGIFIAVILWLTINKDSKGFSVLITLTVCVTVISVSVSFLQPIISFIQKVLLLGDLDDELLAVILKVVGIGLITEISTLICKDAGNESMGKSLQILSVSVVIWMSIPIFDKLLSLLDKILLAV